MTALFITLSVDLQACDPNIFPYIHLLLPMDHDDNRETFWLGFIPYEKPIDYDAIVQKIAEQQPRRMLLVDPIFEES